MFLLFLFRTGAFQGQTSSALMSLRLRWKKLAIVMGSYSLCTFPCYNRIANNSGSQLLLADTAIEL